MCITWFVGHCFTQDTIGAAAWLVSLFLLIHH